MIHQFVNISCEIFLLQKYMRKYYTFKRNSARIGSIERNLAVKENIFINTYNSINKDRHHIERRRRELKCDKS